MFDDIFDANFFDDDIVEEDVDYEYDDYDDAYEDVDMFDENYFEAMEGPARDYRREHNKGKTQIQLQNEREQAKDGSNYYIRAAKNRDFRDALLAANTGGSKIRNMSENRAREAYARLNENNARAARERRYGDLKEIHYKDVVDEMNHPNRSAPLPNRPVKSVNVGKPRPKK